MNNQECAYWRSPFGMMKIMVENGKIIYLKKCSNEETAVENASVSGLIAEIICQLKEYFSGKRKVFDLPIALSGTAFQEKVWQALRAIPYGETRSYQEIAYAVGNAKSSRAVGRANHQNPIAIVVPCHRVIGTSGKLIGYAGGLDMKQKLLELESKYATIPENADQIRAAFSQQASGFNQYQKNFSKEEYCHAVIEKIGFDGSEKVLEVAAGTCGFGRLIASKVAHITELDATEAMLAVGKKDAIRTGVKNCTFTTGFAESLPFPDATFDTVVSRLAFHHFQKIRPAFAEMFRVLKSGGKLVILDMEARPVELRSYADNLERLRDPSHVRCVSGEELDVLADDFKIKKLFGNTTVLPVAVADWLALTHTSTDAERIIRQAFDTELVGGEKTGMEPFRRDHKLFFYHRWMARIYKKTKEVKND